MTERELIEPILDVANAAQELIRAVDDEKKKGSGHYVDWDALSVPLRESIDYMRQFYCELGIQAYLMERAKTNV